MSLQLPRLEYGDPGGAADVVVGDDAGMLTAVARRDVGLAVWCRQVESDLAAWIDGLAPAALPTARLLLRPDAARRAVTRLLSEAQGAAVPQQAALASDIARLVQGFAELSGVRLVDLRLEAVSHDACWRFHYDRVRLRLACTYRGPATQWVPIAARERALTAQRRYDGPLHELPRFAVALFKGALAAGEVGVVHRSPPLAGSGQTRLFLCLNEPTSVSPPLWEG